VAFPCRFHGFGFAADKSDFAVFDDDGFGVLGLVAFHRDDVAAVVHGSDGGIASGFGVALRASDEGKQREGKEETADFFHDVFLLFEVKIIGFLNFAPPAFTTRQEEAK
jgi:hypothetical protein